MKKFVLFIFFLLLLFGCKDDTNMIKCKGIPDVNQAFAYMYFKTEYEGYLFGTSQVQHRTAIPSAGVA